MTTTGLPYETQHQRWIKYGANVALSVILVIAVAVIVTVIARRVGKSIDTTANGVYSLKPQTLNIIHNLKSPVRIVSLYTRPTGVAVQQTKTEVDYGQVVADLL